MNQEQLYQQFLADTKALRDKLEADVTAINQSVQDFREPYDRQFAIDVSPIKETLLPAINEIEAKHKYACHKIAVCAHRKIDKLERERQAKLAPLQKQYEELAADLISALAAIVDPKIVEANEKIEQLATEFSRINKPAHELYLEKAKALEMEILNTPVTAE